ncbi:MAG: class C sortase [Firmicutes bacterium]|nr:class C sortase [Bacillota bacterium]
MSKKLLNKILLGVIFLAGLSLLLYPLIANKWNTYRQQRLISNYEQVIADKEAAGEIDYPAEWARARKYNDSLMPSILPDAFSAADNETGLNAAYMECLNIAGDGIMGTIEIPKIKITLPIFHTTTEEVLEQAAGHLEGSFLPVGGENTHAVITAHRGLPSAVLFTDLDKMDYGDHFLLHILDDVLAYQVDQIVTVEPDQTEELQVVEGQDLVTLVTCTPYGVNSHRLMVRGHRVPYDPSLLADETLPLGGFSLTTSFLFWVIVGLLMTGGFIYFLYRREKKLKAAAAAKALEGPEHEAEEPKQPATEEPEKQAEPKQQEAIQETQEEPPAKEPEQAPDLQEPQEEPSDSPSDLIEELKAITPEDTQEEQP